MARPIRIEGDIAYVPLTKGYEAVIDAADVPLVAGRSWQARESRRPDGSLITVYAQAAKPGKTGTIKMHRLLLGEPAGAEVDHRDGNGLNNRRSSNLRAATTSQNRWNARTPRDNTSGAKGVTWHALRQKWMAQIQAHGRHHYLGLFATQEAAAAAYARASAEIHGEFGRVA